MPKLLTSTEHPDFLRLIVRQFATSDFDTEHPLCLWLIEREKLTYEQGLWLSFLYMAYYDEASAWATFRDSEPFTVPENTEYPIGTNRRNLFGGKIRKHFESLRQCYKSVRNWPTHNFTGEPRRDWEQLKKNLGEVWGNGRFACYTTAEMIQKVNGARVEITGFDNKDSSGPADGITRVYNCERSVPVLDAHGERAYQRVLRAKINPTYVGVDRGVVESVLCNFSGICRGKFYSGRNVDRQQQRIMRVEAMGVDLEELWEGRLATLNHGHLGELNGWEGIDRKRLLHYRDTGELLWTYEGR